MKFYLVRPIQGKRIHKSLIDNPLQTKCGLKFTNSDRVTIYTPDGATFAIRMLMYKACKRCNR